MATLKELEVALRNADAAGDTEAATKLAAAYRQMAGEQKKPEPKQERSFGESVGRQLGLTARSAIGGVGSLANMFADPIVGGINAMGGNLPIPSQALERTMTNWGLPEPASATERFSQGVNRGMVGAAAGRWIPGSPQAIGTQIAAGGAAGGGVSAAEQMGGGPVAQTIAGLTAGVVAPSAIVAATDGARAVARSVPSLVEPLTKSGQERMAARALQDAARNKSAAIASAKSAPEYVPGSVPTLAQATDDVGLAAQGKALEQRFKDDFAARYRQNDAARQSGLERTFGDQIAVTMAEAERNTVTSALRDKAFKGAKNVNVKPIISTADAILKSGAGKRQEVEKSLNWIKSRVEGEKAPQRLYAVRQDINDILSGKYAGDPEKASYRLAKGELTAIKGVLDAQLEKAAPGFKRYIAEYAARSKEIDRAKLGQEIADKATNKLTESLSPAQFTREFEKRGQEIADAGPVASDALTRVAMDFRRAASPTQAVKAAGSDTMQNFVANNLLSRAGVQGGGPVSNAASRATGFLYKPFGAEDRILELMRDAHLDPKGEGARLLSMGLSKMPPSVIGGLLQKLNAIPLGGLLGINAAN